MFPVVHRIAELELAPQGTPEIELRVTLVGESEAAVKLDGTITGESKRVTSLGLGHAQC